MNKEAVEEITTKACQLYFDQKLTIQQAIQLAVSQYSVKQK